MLGENNRKYPKCMMFKAKYFALLKQTNGDRKRKASEEAKQQ